MNKRSLFTTFALFFALLDKSTAQTVGQIVFDAKGSVVGQVIDTDHLYPENESGFYFEGSAPYGRTNILVSLSRKLSVKMVISRGGFLGDEPRPSYRERVFFTQDNCQGDAYLFAPTPITYAKLAAPKGEPIILEGRHHFYRGGTLLYPEPPYFVATVKSEKYIILDADPQPPGMTCQPTYQSTTYVGKAATKTIGPFIPPFTVR